VAASPVSAELAGTSSVQRLAKSGDSDLMRRELREGPRCVCVGFVWRHIGAVTCVGLRFVRIRSCMATVGAIRSQIWETGRWVRGRDVMSFSFIYRCTWEGEEG
jgi:hypothetical protein